MQEQEVAELLFQDISTHGDAIQTGLIVATLIFFVLAVALSGRLFSMVDELRFMRAKEATPKGKSGKRLGGYVPNPHISKKAKIAGPKRPHRFLPL